MSVASLAVTKTYADGASLTEAKLDAAFQSIQTYTLTSLVNNFNQLRKDAFGTVYDYDNDGNANRTNTLYNKQTASIFYTTTLSSLGTSTDATPKLVSASLHMVFAAEATGKYMIGYQFVHNLQVQNNGDVLTGWYIVNRTSGATIIGTRSGHLQTMNAGDVVRSVIPVHLFRMVNISSTAAATYSLYKQIITAAATIDQHTIQTNATQQTGVYGYIHKI